MKTKYLILAAAVLALAACNKQEAPATAELSAPAAISFDGYLNRGVATRSGAAGLLDAAALQDAGFGVFAYYTDFNAYDDQATPNFMYNQHVTYNGGNWEYTPVKYWPNEYGDKAISDDIDKVSFFAYAPFVDVTPSTGKVEDATFGITGMNRNSASGDPILKYIGCFDPEKSVDLCWGVAAETDAAGWSIVQTGAAQTPAITAGKPWIDVQRPADPTAGQKLKFTFEHALSQLNVQIDADVDIVDHAETPALADSTKIYVRSISFTGLAMKGALNLNNSIADKAEWLDYAGINDISAGEAYVIYDGRKDGREGVAGATASNEKSLGLNPVIISDDGNTQVGVTATPVNLFGTSKTTTTTVTNPETGDPEDVTTPVAIGVAEPIYVIPVDEEITITIDYDVETVDNNLPNLLSDGVKYGSKINNKISKTVTFGTAAKFENGKSYVIKLHLGMNSVKFDADIVSWVDGGETDTWLPANQN